MLHLLLSAFTGVEIAVVVCIVVLCVTLLIMSIVVLSVTTKRRGEAERKRTKQNPIIIHQTRRITVPGRVAEPVIVYVKDNKAEEIAEEESAIADALPEEQPEPAASEETENAMRYNRSFRARLIQSDDEVKEWYATIKNTVMAYDRVSSRISWKYESFNYRRNAVAKLFIKGKTLYLYLPLKASDYAGTKYKLEDVSKVAQFADTPALYKLKSERRVKYAEELLAEVCQKLGSKHTDREPVDYYEPYNSDVALIKKGLVKRVIEDAKTSFIGASGFSKEQDEDTEFDGKK